MAGQGDRAAKMADRIREIIAKRIERGCAIRGWGSSPSPTCA